jgi:hypothetical protein
VNVPAKEFTNSPDTPKSHNLTFPSPVIRILDGLISGIREERWKGNTSMNDLPLMQVR